MNQLTIVFVSIIVLVIAAIFIISGLQIKKWSHILIGIIIFVISIIMNLYAMQATN